MLVNVSLCSLTAIAGNSGSLVSFDSNTAKTRVASGKFNDISSSWTLVP